MTEPLTPDQEARYRRRANGPSSEYAAFGRNEVASIFATLDAERAALARDPEGPMLVPHTCPYCSGLHYASVPPATGQNPEVSR